MNKEKIIVFGRGMYFREKREFFTTRFEIFAFIDNAIKSGEVAIDSQVPVYNPSDVLALPPYNIYCVSGDFVAMWRQLDELGVEGKRIKFGTSIPPLQKGIEQIAFGHGEKIYAFDHKLHYISDVLGERILCNPNDLKKIVREILLKENADILMIQNLSCHPASTVFGSERGKAIDRYYIERFLKENSDYIKGTVLEVLNNNYTMKFGGDMVAKSVVSHVKGWGNHTILCNFETGEGVLVGAYDCIICTQTLQYIYDVRSAMNNIYRMLKKGGCALITVPGIKSLCEYDDNNWGEYWSFTVKSMEKLIDGICPKENIYIKQYGNVKTATAYLYGICVEELHTPDFEYDDPRYPFLIGVRVIKN